MSCDKTRKETTANYKNLNPDTTMRQAKSSVDVKRDCPIDSATMLTSEYNGIRFFTENNLRGNGVVTISLTKKLEILNLDKTIYGNISMNNDEEMSLEIQLPKTVIAREIIPNSEFKIFSFDAENPETDENYLMIFINKEKKLIEKKGSNYTFYSWDKYTKSAFIQITSRVPNTTENERLNLYKTLEIKDDSMKIKSVQKTECDYVENYKAITKWIRWKDKNCKLINYKFCY
jgi:hypothetical protein